MVTVMSGGAVAISEDGPSTLCPQSPVGYVLSGYRSRQTRGGAGSAEQGSI